MPSKLPPFKNKGIIVKSSLANNIKVVIGLYPDSHVPDASVEKYVPLVKVLVKRIRSKGSRYVSDNLHKNWLNLRETYSVLLALQRAIILMEEYEEGLIDLEQVLSEDEDVAPEVRMAYKSIPPDIDNMFSENEETENEEE